MSANARSRVMVAAVAVGAFAAAGAGQAASMDRDSVDGDSSPVDGSGATAALGVGSGGGGNVVNTTVTAPDLVLSKKSSNATLEARKLAENQRIISKQAAERAEKKRQARLARLEAMRPKVVQPAEGSFTSGFGARWGTTHYGMDVANEIGTPIVAAADGVILEAGPASGFGNWVRQQLPDGTILVYGHMQSYDVSAGQKVKAGDKIADMGAEGQSTGPHLHFEVWEPGGQKIDPMPWLQEQGVDL